MQLHFLPDKVVVVTPDDITFELPTPEQLRDVVIIDFEERPEIAEILCTAKWRYVVDQHEGEPLIALKLSLTPSGCLMVKSEESPLAFEIMGCIVDHAPDIGSFHFLGLRRAKKARRDPPPDSSDFVRRLVEMFLASDRPEAAFTEAARWGSLEWVELLLAKGIDVNIVTEHGSTALMLAASGGSLEVVRRLLAAGADVNAQNQFGRTALMGLLGALHKKRVYLAIAKELLNAGADTSPKDHEGRTALDYALPRKHEELIRLLNAANN